MDHRRRSYASVAGGSSGAGSGAGPARAGALASLANPSTASSSYVYAIETDSFADPAPAAISASEPAGHATNIPGSWGRGTISSSGPKHWNNSAAGSHAAEKSMATYQSLRPSYLRGTRYMEKLEAAHRAKAAARHEVAGYGPSHHRHSSNGGSLSTSSSSVSLHKMAPSHRGMTYEIVESAPVSDEDIVPLLPSQWKEYDRSGGLEITGDGLELRCTGVMRSQEHEAAAARTDHPIPSQCGIYYYEVSVLHKGKEGMVAIGFSSSKVSLDRLPGWEPDSWAFHGDDGKSYCCQIAGKNYGPTFSVNDTVGCGINFRTNTAFFTKNGVDLGLAFKEIKDTKLYPSVGMKKMGTQVRLNFGQSPFMFDIDGLMGQERLKIQDEINAASIKTLLPTVDESTLIKELVNQFLRHDGYVDTVEAFTEETAVENTALQQDLNGHSSSSGLRPDIDAVHRQQIRSAVLEGDIDRTLKLTSTYYPHVLEDNPEIDFRLRCRKFVEMMRQSHKPLIKARGTTNGHGGLSEEIFTQEMELDEPTDVPDDWDRMDTEDTRTNGINPSDRMRETMEYGTILSQQYRDDPTKEQALKEIFSLFAYPDLQNSPAAPILDVSGRVPVAEELNSAILVSLGKSSSAAIEKIYRQTETLIDSYLSDSGGPGAFVHPLNSKGW